jgi:hypothetical protein
VAEPFRAVHGLCYVVMLQNVLVSGFAKGREPKKAMVACVIEFVGSRASKLVDSNPQTSVAVVFLSVKLCRSTTTITWVQLDSGLP